MRDARPFACRNLVSRFPRVHSRLVRVHRPHCGKTPSPAGLAKRRWVWCGWLTFMVENATWIAESKLAESSRSHSRAYQHWGFFGPGMLVLDFFAGSFPRIVTVGGLVPPPTSSVLRTASAFELSYYNRARRNFFLCMHYYRKQYGPPGQERSEQYHICRLHIHGLC